MGKFVKGQSGNPSGKMWIPPDVKEALISHTGKAVDVIIDLLDCSDKKLRLLASQEILNRTMGKPNQPIDLAGADGDAFKRLKIVIERE